jgi:cytochrome c2
MTFAGLPKPQDIANVIAYLKTFDIKGNPASPAPAN